MKVLALTGGIAGGKSTVARFFEEMGAVVLNADRIAHKTYEPGTPLFEDLKTRYGPSILAGGRIDREHLGEIVFGSAEERIWLESRTHPATRRLITEQLSELTQKNPPLVLVEAALHVETGYYREFDGLIVIYVPYDIAIQRLKARDGLSEEEAELRLKSQMPIEEKKKFADWLIDNSGGLEETKKQVRLLYNELISSVPPPKESPPHR